MPTDRTRLFPLWVPVVAYMAAIFYASSLSQPPMPAGGDKPWHFLAYLGLAIVIVRAVAGRLPTRIDLRTAASALLIGVAYAASDEIHQMFVPGRFADLSDWLADAVGVCTGTSACWAWGIISPAARNEL